MNKIKFYTWPLLQTVVDYTFMSTYSFNINTDNEAVIKSPEHNKQETLII